MQLKLLVFGLSMIGASAAPAAEQALPADQYPTKAARIVVGFTPGGSNDMAARIASQKLTEILGGSFIVDNRAGANGAIGARIVASAKPDGYTLLLIAIPYVMDAALGTKLPYDILSDFSPITQIFQSPHLVVVSTNLPVRNIAELIALAKTKPKQLNYGSTGTGGSNHLVTEMFAASAGISIVHVPYKGTSSALSDLVPGEIQLMFSSLASALPLTRSGKLRALAVTSSQRSSFLPDIPALAETLPGFETTGWTGLAGPSGTPSAISDRIFAAMKRGLQSPDVKAQLAADGMEVVANTPAEFGRFLREELSRYSKVIKALDIRPGPQ